MDKIILGTKGSASSGNKLHAGRPGMVGGSRPRNYNDAMTTFQSWPWKYRHAFPVDVNNLNKQGLQAILDFKAGTIDVNTMYNIVQDPASNKGGAALPPPWKTGAATPTTPVAQPAPVAPLPPPPPPTLDPAAKTLILATQNDPTHDWWAKNIDVNNLTPDQIKAVNALRGAGKGFDQDELKAILAPNAKDPRFFQGTITDKTTAEEIFKGSPKEMQDFALKYGIMPTDAKAMQYIKEHGQQWEKQGAIVSGYPAVFDKNTPVPYNGAKGYATTMSDFTTTVASSNRVDRYVGPYGAAEQLLKDGGLTPKERVVVDKLAAGRNGAETVYSNVYDKVKLTSGYYDANRAGRAAESDFIKNHWNGMTKDEKDLAASLYFRNEVANWVNSYVPQTLKDNQGNLPKNWSDISVKAIPHDDNLDLKKFGYEYRGNFLTRKQPPVGTPSVKGGYSDKNITAISTLPKAEIEKLKTKVEQEWDHQQHSFSGTVNNAFKVHPQSAVIKKYESVATARDNVHDGLYHGTDYVAARHIAAGGYKVFPASKAKAGRAMGDGIYLADKSSKSAQYIYSSGGWGSSRDGMMFLNKASFGQVVDVNQRYYSSGDTVQGLKPYWRNNEWCVKDASAVLPDIWIDIHTY